MALWRLYYHIAYVENQKIHHQQNTTISMLERIDHNNDPPQIYKLSNKSNS